MNAIFDQFLYLKSILFVFLIIYPIVTNSTCVEETVGSEFWCNINFKNENTNDPKLLDCYRDGVQILRKGVQISGETQLIVRPRLKGSFELKIAIESKRDGGRYSCRAEGQDGTPDVCIKVRYPPQIPSTPNDRFRPYLGENLEVPCVIIDGYPPATITWRRKVNSTGSIIPNYEILPKDNPRVSQVENKLVITSTQFEDANIYQCKADNGINPYKTMDVTVEIREKLQVSAVKYFNATQGRSVTLHFRVRGNPPPIHYQWKRNGDVFPIQSCKELAKYPYELSETDKKYCVTDETYSHGPYKPATIGRLVNISDFQLSDVGFYQLKVRSTEETGENGTVVLIVLESGVIYPGGYANNCQPQYESLFYFLVHLTAFRLFRQFF